PFRRQLLRGRYVADGGVEPYVVHLSFGACDRHGNAPVEVAADVAGLEASVEPALALAVHVGFPLLVFFEYPPAQERFVPVERQVPVAGFAQHRLRTRYGTARVDEVGGVERTAAFLALVAVSPFA